MTPTYSRRRSLWLLGSIFLPFVLQTALVIVAKADGNADGWRVSGLIPVLAGFVCLERAVKLYAAPLAFVYVPVMMWAMFFLTFIVVGMVFGDYL